ncbi:spore coat protein GerQ [Paenibacillus agricola]|uniref:Spore coat protein GerQ n=1 Tax=Paenibacillus agricola TaxID=2716264 RepID=A0ABX0J264_9BACL|nr:spore coat protein GerQ [Paenibacillus agricola]NHN30427.1 spore coat protein GerQ [Paenibacillus agricola]
MNNNPYRSGTPYPSYPGGYMQMPMGAPQTGQYSPPPGTPSGSFIPGTSSGPTTGSPTVPGLLPLEQSFIENILRLNLGKMATIYMTYENNSEWNAKIFKGRLEAAGRDHIIISDPKTGMRYLLLMVNLDYITFDEELNYTYPYGNPMPGR